MKLQKTNIDLKLKFYIPDEVIFKGHQTELIAHNQSGKTVLFQRNHDNDSETKLGEDGGEHPPKECPN